MAGSARPDAAPDDEPRLHVHASCVLVGEGAVLVRGAASSGKTSLCLGLIDLARAQGLFSRLVGDDRIALAARHGRLLGRPLPAIAGLVERRGLGLAPIAHEPCACIRLVVDCTGAQPARMPEPEALVTELAGLTLPRLAVSGGREDAQLVLAALGLFNDEPWVDAPAPRPG
jgi:serine kinase of HPr protein (carbohydrate metabolism regulator)